MKKVALLVSGGVDSSVSLALCKENGYDVTAFYLKIWLEDELSFLGDCPWKEDLSFVEKLCAQHEVPLKIINLQKAYFSKVISLSLAQIKLGQTPNPDIFCNSLIKFGAFLDCLRDEGIEFDYVATGHYARTKQIDDLVYLKKADDPVKDQTYFLAKLRQDQIKNVLFPIGDYPKAQVRELAKTFNVPAQDRKDSQGLCFLGKIDFSDFLQANLGVMPGDFVDFDTNKVIGKHDGFWFYTIGQRKGMGLSGGPWYVVKKDVEKNIVYISRQYHAEDKIRNSFFVADFNWIAKSPFELLGSNACEIDVKIRHGASSYSCLLTLDESDSSRGFVKLNNANDQGIAAGQFAVFYYQDLCLGSAMII